jgi:hypothetical protein
MANEEKIKIRELTEKVFDDLNYLMKPPEIHVTGQKMRESDRCAAERLFIFEFWGIRCANVLDEVLNFHQKYSNEWESLLISTFFNPPFDSFQTGFARFVSMIK